MEQTNKDIPKDTALAVIKSNGTYCLAPTEKYYCGYCPFTQMHCWIGDEDGSEKRYNRAVKWFILRYSKEDLIEELL